MRYCVIRVLSRPAWSDRGTLRSAISSVESSEIDCSEDEVTYRIPVMSQKNHATTYLTLDLPVQAESDEIVLRIRRRCARCNGPCRNKKECDDRMVVNAARVLSTRDD